MNDYLKGERTNSYGVPPVSVTGAPPWHKRKIFASFLLLGVVLIGLLLFLSRPPKEFPVNTPFIVPDGASLRLISTQLAAKGYVRSSAIFEFWMIAAGGEYSLDMGVYLFKEPLFAGTLARAIRDGIYTHAARVVFPEGTTVKGMGEIAAKALTGFSASKFSFTASTSEGYLFPDTYFLPIGIAEEDVVDLLKDTFEQKTKTLREFAETNGYTWNDVVIMASLLEEEAQSFSDKRMVSDILWKRLRNGMLLQVDAPFLYILGKGTFQLSREDLAINSPYNTYRFKGLPPTPISNPGLESLAAAVTPLSNPYLFYLSDPDGKLYYARNFEEHKINRAKYLR